MEEKQHKVDWHISSKEAFTHYLTASYPVSFYQLQISGQNLRNPSAQEYSLCWEVCQACPTRDSQNLRPETRFIGPFTFSEQSDDIPPITTSSFLRREHIFPTVWFWGPNPHGVTGSWRRLERYNHSYVTDCDAEEAEGCCCLGSC